MRMVQLALPCILLFGRPLLTLSGGGLSQWYATLPGFLVLLGFGLLGGFRCLALVLVGLMLPLGLSLLAFWLKSCVFWAHCIGHVMLGIWELVASRIWSC